MDGNNMRKVAKTVDQLEAEQEQEKDKRDEPKVLRPVREAIGLYSVEYSSGGEVPDALKGRWTSMAKVEAAIENYMASKQVSEASA